MLTFTEYYKAKQLFLEMPRVANAHLFELDDDDTAYINQFLRQLDDDAPQAIKDAVIRKAFMYRYNKDNLLNPTPDTRDIPIETDYRLQTGEDKDKNPVFKKTPFKKTFKGIHTGLEHLAQKFDNLGYDIAQLKNSNNDLRQLGQRLSQQWQNWQRGGFNPEDAPEIHQSYALKPEFQNKDTETKTRGKLTHGMTNIGNYSKGAPSIDTHTPEIKSAGAARASQKLKEPIGLDADDWEFINYFVMNDGNKPLPKKGEPANFPKGLVPAFYWRYSGDPFKDPQARKSPPGFEKYPPGEYMNLTFAGKHFVGVPVHLDKLRNRLEDLKSKGVDFLRQPLDRTPAIRWLQNRMYKPGSRASLEKDRTFQSGNLEQYMKAQEDHLREPDKNPSPNMPSASSRRQPPPDATWYDILQADAEHGTRMGVVAAKAASQKASGHIDDSAIEDFTNQALTFLMSDDATSKPEYPQQDWRIEKVKELTRQLAKNMLDGGGKDAGDTDMTAIAGGRATGAELADREKAHRDEIEGYTVPSLDDIKDDPSPPVNWRTAVASYLTLNLHLGDQFKNEEIDQIAEKLAKLMVKFKELNDEPPNTTLQKHLADMVIDDYRANAPKDDSGDGGGGTGPKPPGAAVDAMRTATGEEPKRKPLTPLSVKQDDVPPEVVAQVGGDAKVTGGQFKSMRDFMKSRQAAQAGTKPPAPVPAAPPVAPPPTAIPVEPKKKGKKKPKPSGPSLFDDLD